GLRTAPSDAYCASPSLQTRPPASEPSARPPEKRPWDCYRRDSPPSSVPPSQSVQTPPTAPASPHTDTAIPGWTAPSPPTRKTPPPDQTAPAAAPLRRATCPPLLSSPSHPS